MNSVKTAVVVVILLGVLYGVYYVLNMPEPHTPPELALREQEAVEPQINVGVPFQPGVPNLGGGPATATYTPPVPDNGQNKFPPLDARPFDPWVGDAKYPDEGDPGPSAPAVEPRPSESPRSQYDPQPRYDGIDTTNARPPADLGIAGLEKAYGQAKEFVAQGKFREALAALSPFYDLPGLSGDQQQALLSWLDPLAGRVIYSPEHHLEPAYFVKSGDTLEDIARQYRVPPDLLKNINQGAIGSLRTLLPGTELKVVRGPFSAHVDLTTRKLTLFLGELYAGHFFIAVGNDPAPFPGPYRVKDKQPGHDYYARNRQVIPAGVPENPYGGFWIDLGSDVTIHGSSGASTSGGQGCISLSPVDAKDVYSILAAGSIVTIRR